MWIAFALPALFDAIVEKQTDEAALYMRLCRLRLWAQRPVPKVVEAMQKPCILLPVPGLSLWTILLQALYSHSIGYLPPDAPFI